VAVTQPTIPHKPLPDFQPNPGQDSGRVGLVLSALYLLGSNLFFWTPGAMNGSRQRCNHHRPIVAVCCPELGEFIAWNEHRAEASTN
jgi:hypothetical protein